MGLKHSVHTSSFADSFTVSHFLLRFRTYFGFNMYASTVRSTECVRENILMVEHTKSAKALPQS